MDEAWDELGAKASIFSAKNVNIEPVSRECDYGLGKDEMKPLIIIRG